MRHLMMGAALLVLAGCATVVDGTRQTVTLNSNAPEALCGIEQKGVEIVAPAPVPAEHVLKRRPGNLIVTCSAPGYLTEKVALVTGKNPKAVALNAPAIATGALFDRMLGGIDEYQNEAYVYLNKIR